MASCLLLSHLLTTLTLTLMISGRRCLTSICFILYIVNEQHTYGYDINLRPFAESPHLIAIIVYSYVNYVRFEQECL